MQGKVSCLKSIFNFKIKIPFLAAIQSRHRVEFRDVPSTGETSPTTIEVGAGQIPLNILFRSASSNLNIQQQHDGAGGSNQETSSEDEPHYLRHSVTKPSKILFSLSKHYSF